MAGDGVLSFPNSIIVVIIVHIFLLIPLVFIKTHLQYLFDLYRRKSALTTGHNIPSSRFYTSHSTQIALLAFWFTLLELCQYNPVRINYFKTHKVEAKCLNYKKIHQNICNLQCPSIAFSSSPFWHLFDTNIWSLRSWRWPSPDNYEFIMCEYLRWNEKEGH